MIKYYLPFLFQGVFMIIDEFYFHRKRILPRWEKIGHPLDTLSVLLTLSIPLILPYRSSNLSFYLFLSIFSCILITKDEFIHADYCEKAEQWLHAVLFILHPIIFFCTYILWSQANARSFLISQVSLVFLFLLYQIISARKPYEQLIKNK